jgi:hypothetical protein
MKLLVQVYGSGIHLKGSVQVQVWQNYAVWFSVYVLVWF